MTDKPWLAIWNRFLQPPGRPVKDSEVKCVLTGKSDAESLSTPAPWAWLVPGMGSLCSGVSSTHIPDEMLIPAEE